MKTSPLSQIRRQAAAIVADARAAATVEMALILPVALSLLGLVMVGGQAFEVQRKVVLAARTVTDLVSQAPYTQDPSVPGATWLGQSALTTDMALAAEIVYPWPSSSLSVVVSQLQVNSSNNTGVVKWSQGYYNGVGLTNGTVVNLSPTMIATGATYLILGQVSYTFQPLGITYATGSMTLSNSELLTPRNAAQIQINSSD